MAVRVDGVKEIEAALRKMSKSFTPEIIQGVLNKHGETLAESMRSFVPVKTGRLKSHIGVLNRPDPKYPYTLIVGVDYNKKSETKGTLTIPALASIIEYGSAPSRPAAYNRSSDTDGTKKLKFIGTKYRRVFIDGKFITMTEDNFRPHPPSPFVRPAFDINKNIIQNGIINDLYDIAKTKAKEEGFDAK